MPAAYYSLVTFDGSLSGGGAFLQVGVPSLEQAASCEIVSYLACPWTDQELEMLRVSRGDPAGQAKLEALTLVTAVNTWQPVLAKAQGRLAFRGDALGILFDMLRYRAKDSMLNDLAGALALLVAPVGLDIRAAHIWSERNLTCDKLSRINWQLLNRSSSHSCSLNDLVGATLDGVRRAPVRRITTALLCREALVCD